MGLVRHEPERLIEIVEAAGLEIENSADEQAGIDFIAVHQHRCQMRAGRPAGYDHAVPSGTVLPRVRAQPIHRGLDFRNELHQADDGAQCVPDHCHVKAGRQWPGSQTCKHLFAVALPVTTVNEDQKRGMRSPAAEQVDRVARPVSISEIETGGISRAKNCAASRPLRKHRSTLRNSLPIVIGGIQFRPVHSAPQRFFHVRQRGGRDGSAASSKARDAIR